MVAPMTRPARPAPKASGLPLVALVDALALKGHPRNSRRHPPEQLAQIEASIREFGFTTPLLIEGQTIVAGHGRQMAAAAMWARGEVIRLPGNHGALPEGRLPAIDATGWSEAQVRAYMIGDNRIPESSEWDQAMLVDELRWLDDMPGFEATLTGFGTDELTALLMVKGGSADPEEAPEPPPEPVSQMGDLWTCGPHRVICGDSTDATTVERLLAGTKPHLMVTDPPYGVEYDAAWRNEATRADGTPYGASAVGKVINDGHADWREAWSLFSGDVTYVWHADRHASEVQASLEAAGFVIRSQIIWAKNTLIISRGDYHWKHEPCWYAVRKGKTGRWSGGRSQTTLWEIDKPQKSETGHSTQKPIECMRRPIVNNSKPGEAIYDPFMGSGTTMIAAQMEGRRAFGVELSPAYVDVICQRWAAFTGQVVVNESGATFDEVSAARKATGKRKRKAATAA